MNRRILFRCAGLFGAAMVLWPFSLPAQDPNDTAPSVPVDDLSGIKVVGQQELVAGADRLTAAVPRGSLGCKGRFFPSC